MPILHVQFRGVGKNASGADVQIPPPHVLAQAGPRIQVSIRLADQVSSQLSAKGLTIEPPVSGYGLIDTGASTTCVDVQAAMKLKLPIVDVVNMCSASHASHKANVYPIHLEMTGFPIQLNVARAMGAELAPQGIIALIGRDVLGCCCFIYNGISGDITLSM